MSFDIYGYGLTPGHCEVHPHVHQMYPCELCFSEDAQTRQRKREEDDYWKQMEAEHYREMEREMIESNYGIDGEGI